MKYLLIVLTVILMSMPSFAENKESPAPANVIGPDENVFVKYGLSEDIPKLGMSSLSQGENILEHAKRIFTFKGDVLTSEVFLVRSTDTKGNIDLRLKYDPRKFEENQDLIKRIEELTKTEYLLKNYSESYDKQSVRAFDKGGEVIEIHFNYASYQLPQTIAYFRFLQVVLTVREGKIIEMTITNSRPFLYEKGYIVEKYKQVVLFTQLKNGKTVIKEKHIYTSGTRKKEPIQLDTHIKTIAFFDDHEETIVLDQYLLAQASDPRMREEKVNIHRPLPLMADLVRRQGIDVPLPYSVALTYRNQNMDLGFSGFNVMDTDLNQFFDPGASIGSIRAQSASVRGGVNILPFWNVFGTVGRVKVDAEVDAQYTGAIRDVLVDKFGPTQAAIICGFAQLAGANICEPGRVRVPIHLNYDMIGLGTTLSVGYRNFFSSLTCAYNATRLENKDNWGEGILTLQPIIGYQLLQYRAQVFVGAEYQRLNYTMEGSLGYIPELERDFTYEIGVKLNRWAYLVGFNKQIARHYNVSMLYNKGETRDAFTVNVGYNW
ncbi:hypothetical protein ACFL6U_25105 [Planctomycetota bacterium]